MRSPVRMAAAGRCPPVFCPPAAAGAKIRLRHAPLRGSFVSLRDRSSGWASISRSRRSNRCACPTSFSCGWASAPRCVSRAACCWSSGYSNISTAPNTSGVSANGGSSIPYSVPKKKSGSAFPKTCSTVWALCSRRPRCPFRLCPRVMPTSATARFSAMPATSSTRRSAACAKYRSI